jgi:hypothetical protein
MINLTKLENTNFNEVFTNLETVYVNELENMLVSNLIENRKVEVSGTESDSLEFLSKTNFKLRLKRPNKNVWSISLQALKNSIKKVLRLGMLVPLDEKKQITKAKTEILDLPVLLLLHTIPDKEYESRSFVGNRVIHPKLGEGIVHKISDSGNVEIQFREKTVLLKPNFIKLKLS